MMIFASRVPLMTVRATTRIVRRGLGTLAEFLVGELSKSERAIRGRGVLAPASGTLLNLVGSNVGEATFPEQSGDDCRSVKRPTSAAVPEVKTAVREKLGRGLNVPRD